MTQPHSTQNPTFRTSAPSDADLRAQYERFCADLKRMLPPVEAEYHGTPTFTEWKEAYGHA
jgi:hypothetical protein